MSVLYVSQPGAEVRKKGGRLYVQRKGQVLAALPFTAVERLVLLGPAQVSAAATRALLDARISVIFCSLRGQHCGTLSTGCDDAELLLTQAARYHDAAYRLKVATAIVSAKVCHQQRLLRRQARNHPHPSFDQVVNRLGALLATLPRRVTVPEVMGAEGQASALYFSVLGLCLRPEGIAFTGRNRRPPKDPVNAVLSLGYMLALGEVMGRLVGEGLHPGIGFLHEVGRRRPALALDVLELARQPIVDRLTLSLFNRKVLTCEDFVFQSSGEVRLKEPSLKRYVEFWERTMTTPFHRGSDGRSGTFRTWLQDQAESLRKSIIAGQPWAPVVLEL
jgi:CRISP-associated protein Cas1